AGSVGTSTVVVTSGADGNLPDALAAGGFGRTVLLAGGSGLTDPTRAWVAARADTRRVYVLGGPSALTPTSYAQAARLVTGGPSS
ncbi:MAG: hypothetical protein ACYCXA_11265, partial [Actinomycetes bacterium]